MPEDMYSDSSPQPEHEAPSGEGYDGETAVLPKSILAGKEFKPGEEVVLKIVAIHDDSVEVKYASESGDEHSEGGEEPEPAAQPDGGGSSSMYE
jgi:hypothetical protein